MLLIVVEEDHTSICLSIGFKNHPYLMRFVPVLHWPGNETAFNWHQSIGVFSCPLSGYNLSNGPVETPALHVKVHIWCHLQGLGHLFLVQ